MIKILRRIFVLLPLLASFSANAVVVINDGTFNDDDWFAGGIVTTGVGAASGTFIGEEQIAFPGDDGVNLAGNPGAFEFFGQVHGGRQNGTMTARGFYLNDVFTYDPSLGALQSLDVSFDALQFATSHNDPTPSDVLTMGVGILQNNFLYFAGGITLTTLETWTLLQFNGLTEGDFTYSGRVDPPPDPDFSETGAPIQFGFYAFNAGNFTSYGFGGVDNFILDVNPQVSPIPVPPAIALFSTGLLCLGFARRKLNR